VPVIGLTCLSALVLGACGGGNERQDENEKKGTYEVDVVSATFPLQQKLAKRSNLAITVRNDDSKTIPDISVTVDGFDRRLKTDSSSSIADPSRPVFVVNGEPKELGGFPESKEASPGGNKTAYVNTWTLGRLKPGQEKTFRWSVTAVKAGEFRLAWEVAAGFDGKAKAVDSTGQRPTGLFIGTIKDKAPDTRVDPDDGKTVIEGVQ
jgi:hypothetical protein